MELLRMPSRQMLGLSKAEWSYDPYLDGTLARQLARLDALARPTGADSTSAESD